MKSLVLKDLARVDELDRAASQSVRGGFDCLKREGPPACPGELTPPIIVRRGWDQCPPLHFGCGPTWFPYGKPPSYPEPKILPL